MAKSITSKNISEVLLLQRCAGCGTCAALCPSEAILLCLEDKRGLFVPKIDNDKCNGCGTCRKVCPGLNLDDTTLRVNYIDKNAPTALLGRYLSTYIGHATDGSIRYAATSGGLITQLLIFALETGAIDGALVTRMKRDAPLQPEPFIARSKEEIIEAATAKYCLVPLGYTLKLLLQCKDKKIAVVGLPCHIRALRSAQRVNPEIGKKVVLSLGLFCSHTLTFKGTIWLLTALGIRKEDVSAISYRGEGWPGEIQIKRGLHKAVSISNQDRLWNTIFNGLFMVPKSCFQCSDLTCEKADLSFGDPWLPEVKDKENVGKSVVICRNQRGQTLLDNAIKAGAIELNPLAPWDVVRSQKTFLHFKKINVLVRQRKVNTGQVHVSRVNWVVACMTRFSHFLGSSALGRAILARIPISILDRYVRLFYKVYSWAIGRDFARLEKSELNILVLHAHWNNRGDEAAIRAMVDSLKDRLPVRRITMMLMTTPGAHYPDEQVETINTYPGGSKLSYLDALFTVVTYGKLSLTRNGRRFLAAVNDADLVIHAPGGPSIGDIYGGRLGDLPNLYRLLVAKIIKKKPLLFYAPSMGAFFKKRYNWLRKFVLKRADRIMLREEISARYLRDQLGLDACVTADSALQNDVPESYLACCPDLGPLLSQLSSSKCVGMIFTDLKWHPVYKDDEETGKKLLACFQSLAEFLVKGGYKILLIPQLFGERNDCELLEKIAAIDRENVSVLPPDVDAYLQQIIISKLFCIITARYHPAIFALKAAVPVIAVYYEHKTKGLLEMAGIQAFGVDVHDVNVPKLINLFRSIEAGHSELRQRLQQAGASLRERAQRTTQIVVDWWKEASSRE
jgi:coenzyme F420 hydrogenase subunit beta